MTEKAIAKGDAFRATHESTFHIKTTFFDSKIRTLFTRFDFDRNGRIEKEDFLNWAGNLARAGDLDGERSAALVKNIMSVWTSYFLPADTNNDGSVEYLELLTHMKAALRGVKDDKTKQKAILDTLPLIFQAIDTNNDGSIAEDEFFHYFCSFGLEDEKFAHDIFRLLDTNSDRAISQEEFVAAGTEFFMGIDNSSPSKYFFGPLC